MLIRIFLPHSLYKPRDSIDTQPQYIYGTKTIDQSNEIITFYVVDSSGSSNRANQCKHLIGSISQEAIDQRQTIQLDHLYFKRRKTAITLQTVHLSQPTTANSNYTVQIFQYDHSTFVQLSQRYNQHATIDHRTNDKCDSIGTLLSTIANVEQSKCLEMQANRRHSLQYWFIGYAEALRTFIRNRTTHIDSAFLKHFLLWTENLDKFTYQT